MSQNKKKILLICPYPEDTAPGQRLRYEQYLNLFRKEGYDIQVSSFMTYRFNNIVYKPGNIPEKIFWTLFGYIKRFLQLFTLWRYDAVYIFLWVTPFGLPLFEKLFVLLNSNMIYDIDDMVFLGHSSKANKFIKILKGTRKITFLMQKAKHIVVSTPSNEAFARKYNNAITDISVAINTDVYLPANKYSNDDVITIGWSGSHSTSRYLFLLEEVLRKFAGQSNIRILVIGDTTFKFNGFDCVTIPWQSATEVKDLQKIDIGLYPLPDEQWVYGKSGGKALQYMALGIPTIATGIGTNFRIIDDGESGFLVRTEEQWIEKIEYLINHPEERKRIGLNGRKKVEKEYSLHVNKKYYLDIFEKVVG
ncbi:MAG TPA: glycosyltransferase [Bacteroidia bacterium]|nr:glycosyltransferase [Bacteroidia bacterium]